MLHHAQHPYFIWGLLGDRTIHSSSRLRFQVLPPQIPRPIPWNSSVLSTLRNRKSPWILPEKLGSPKVGGWGARTGSPWKIPKKLLQGWGLGGENQELGTDLDQVSRGSGSIKASK